jgi:hypothetical protein
VTRLEAQRRADRIGAFEAELRDLTRETGLTLTLEQRAAIAARHATLLSQYAAQFDVVPSGRVRRLSLGMQAAALAGAAALAASLFLFFLSVWGLLSTTAQVAAVVSAPFLLVAATDATARSRRALPFVSILATVAFAAFVLDLRVLGRIFALAPTPEALLACGVFAVALAYGYDSRLLIAAGAVCLSAWVAASVVRATGVWWQAFDERPESLLVAAWAVWGWALLPHRTRDAFPPVLRAIAVLTAAVAFLVPAAWAGCRGSLRTRMPSSSPTRSSGS